MSQPEEDRLRTSIPRIEEVPPEEIRGAQRSRLPRPIASRSASSRQMVRRLLASRRLLRHTMLAREVLARPVALRSTDDPE